MGGVGMWGSLSIDLLAGLPCLDKGPELFMEGALGSFRVDCTRALQLFTATLGGHWKESHWWPLLCSVRATLAA